MVVRPRLVTLVFDLTEALLPEAFCALGVTDEPLVERTLRLDCVAVPLPEEAPEVVERRICVPGVELEEEEEDVPLLRRTVDPVLFERVAPDPVEVVPAERRTVVPELPEEELPEELLLVPLPLLIWEDEEGEEVVDLVEEDVPEERTVLEELLPEERTVPEELPDERTVLPEERVVLFWTVDLDEDEDELVLPLLRRTCEEEEPTEERVEEELGDADELDLLTEEEEDDEVVVLVEDPDEPVRRVCAERSAGSMIRAAAIADARAV